jgi:hypothetical protein
MSQARHDSGGGQSEAASLLEAVQNPELLRDRLEGLTAERIGATRQETGHQGAHTIGENMVDNLGLRCWHNVVASLEDSPLPGTEQDMHPFLEFPRAGLDSLLHLSELDKLRLEEGHLEGLPRQRRKFFKWLMDRPEVTRDLRNGGRDFLAYGPKGSGKSTFAVTWVARLLEVNNEAVVWRGTQARSEWLPLAPWTRLVLPEGLEVEAVLESPVDGVGGVSVDLEEVVREVVRYRSIRHLNHEVLAEGEFHVVFPDPRFRGADAVYRDAEEVAQLDHFDAWEVSDGEAPDGLEEPTPVTMWWFAWAIGKIDLGPPMPMAWVCDEVGNVMPEHASNDYHDQYARIEAFRNKFVDARRNNFSLFGIGHDLDDLHNLMRKKLRWRVTMAGMDNPTGKTLGMGEAPMDSQYSGNMTLGEALLWNKQQFSPFSWDDIAAEYKVPGQLHVRFPGFQEVVRSC